jgi:hypothetical protein
MNVIINALNERHIFTILFFAACIMGIALLVTVSATGNIDATVLIDSKVSVYANGMNTNGAETDEELCRAYASETTQLSFDEIAEMCQP